MLLKLRHHGQTLSPILFTDRTYVVAKEADNIVFPRSASDLFPPITLIYSLFAIYHQIKVHYHLVFAEQPSEILLSAFVICEFCGFVQQHSQLVEFVFHQIIYIFCKYPYHQVLALKLLGHILLVGIGNSVLQQIFSDTPQLINCLNSILMAAEL